MKYYYAYDRTFIADTFDSTFKDINGNIISASICGASVMIAVISLKKGTGEPIYSSKENEGTDEIKYFEASINPELGAVIIPNGDMLDEVSEDIIISAKIIGYTIDIWEKPYVARSCSVSEDTFKQFIHDNFENFNRSDNYFAQTTCYQCFQVDKEYPRLSYRVGYDSKSEPIIEEYGQAKSQIVHFYSSAETMDIAKGLAEKLSKMTPDEMYSLVLARNKRVAEEGMARLGG